MGVLLLTMIEGTLAQCGLNLVNPCAACGHRTWDGVAAAAFLNRVAANLVRPLELIRPIIGSE